MKKGVEGLRDTSCFWLPNMDPGREAVRLLQPKVLVSTQTKQMLMVSKHVKGSKERYLLRRKHNLQSFGVIPFIKPWCPFSITLKLPVNAMQKNQTDFMNMYCNVQCTTFKTICRAFTPKVSLVRIPKPTITNKMTDNCGTPVAEPPLRKQKFYRKRIKKKKKKRTEYMALNLIPINLSEL